MICCNPLVQSLMPKKHKPCCQSFDSMAVVKKLDCQIKDFGYDKEHRVQESCLSLNEIKAVAEFRGD